MRCNDCHWFNRGFCEHKDGRGDFAGREYCHRFERDESFKEVLRQWAKEGLI